MNLHAVLFYLIATFILIATGLAVTRQNPVHAVIYLVFSFLGSAMLFFLLGAFFIAVLEVIIYAGAVMVLFLFVVMTLRVEKEREPGFSPGAWKGPISLGAAFLLISSAVILLDPAGRIVLETAAASPGQFGYFVFGRYWLAVELVSLLLLLGLLAAVHLGRSPDPVAKEGPE